MQRWSKVGLMCLLMIWVIGTEPLQGEINDGTMSGATSKTFSGEKVSLEPMPDELRTVLQKAGVVDLMETAKTSEDWKKVVEVMKTLTDQVKQKESLFYLYMLIFKSGIKATAGVEPVDWANLLAYGIQARKIGSELDPLPQKAYGSLLLDIQAAEIKAGRYQDALALGKQIIQRYQSLEDLNQPSLFAITAVGQMVTADLQYLEELEKANRNTPLGMATLAGLGEIVIQTHQVDQLKRYFTLLDQYHNERVKTLREIWSRWFANSGK